jgi:hypothetical protein
MSNLTYKTVCDVCYRKTWYDAPKNCQYGPCEGNLKPIDYSSIPEKFKRYLTTGERIRVKFSWGEVRTGTVGMTTGWRPALLLMLTRRSLGSSYILDESTEFTTEKVRRF